MLAAGGGEGWRGAVSTSCAVTAAAVAAASSGLALLELRPKRAEKLESARARIVL